jgi:hypothetical protein
MTIRAIEPEQRPAAKVAGFLYLFTMAASIFSVSYVRGHLIVAEDAAQTARRHCGVRTAVSTRRRQSAASA